MASLCTWMLMLCAEQAGRKLPVIGGRYGLGSKDTTPASIFAVYEELQRMLRKQDSPWASTTTLPTCPWKRRKLRTPLPKAPSSCKFWGLGGDGTVGANKNSIKIIGDHTDKYVQAYFQYDSKKTGGVTISHLRFGDKPIKSPTTSTRLTSLPATTRPM